MFFKNLKRSGFSLDHRPDLDRRLFNATVGTSKRRWAQENLTPTRSFIWTSDIAILDTWDGIIIVALISSIAQHYCKEERALTFVLIL